MEPLNNEERKAARLKFLGLFSITFLVLAIAMFLMSYVSNADYQQLKEDSTNYRQDKAMVGNVNKVLTNLNVNFAKYNPGDLPMETTIKTELDSVTYLGKQNLPVGQTLQKVYEAYMGSYQVKQDLKKYAASKDQIDQLKADKEEYQNKWKDCTLEFATYKQMHPSN